MTKGMIEIVYKLSQAGQRASLLSGGNGLAFQTIEVPISAKLLPLAKIDLNGYARIDLSAPNNLVRIVVKYGKVFQYPYFPVFDAPVDIVTWLHGYLEKQDQLCLDAAKISADQRDAATEVLKKWLEGPKHLWADWKQVTDFDVNDYYYRASFEQPDNQKTMVTTALPGDFESVIEAELERRREYRRKVEEFEALEERRRLVLAAEKRGLAAEKQRLAERHSRIFAAPIKRKRRKRNVQSHKKSTPKRRSAKHRSHK